MKRAQRIETILSQALSVRQLEVIDDSQKHAGHAGARPGGETHYTIKIAADALTGKSRVEQHRIIYALLDEEFKQRLHALSIIVYL